MAAIADGLTTALGELRELAHGIHPSILVDEGLDSALRSLTEHSAVPVRLLAAPAERLRPAVEAVAYFVASEALANAAKHASASEVLVSVRRSCRGGRPTLRGKSGRARNVRTCGDPMRVVIAEDSLLFREGMTRLLTEAGFEVVAQAGDAEELRVLVEHHRPEVAIVDIRMPPG